MLMPQGFINKSSMTPGIGRRTPNRCKKIGCGKRVRHCLQSTRRDSEANKYVTVADFFGYQLFGATTVSSGLDAYLSLLSGKSRGGWLVSLI